MTARFGRDWWPEGTRQPYMRLAAGLILSPAVIAILATAVAYIVAGSALPDAASVHTFAQQAAAASLLAFLAFMATFGLATVALLWAGRRRTATTFAAAGGAAGILFAGLTALAFSAPLSLAQPLILGGMGALSLLVVRWIAGIRDLQAPAPQ